MLGQPISLLVLYLTRCLTRAERLQTGYGLCPKNQTSEVREEPPIATQTSIEEVLC